MGLPVLAAALGSAGQTGLNFYSANRAYQKQRDMAGDQMVFQERMSSTAHQREVADLKAAGLNPILSANGGASTPSGAMGSAPAAEVGDAVGSAMEAARTKKELDLAEKQAHLLEQQANKEFVQAKQVTQATRNAQLEENVLRATMPAVIKEAQVREAHADIDKKSAVFDAIVNRAGNLGSAAGNVLRNILQPKPTSKGPTTIHNWPTYRKP